LALPWSLPALPPAILEGVEGEKIGDEEMENMEVIDETCGEDEKIGDGKYGS